MKLLKFEKPHIPKSRKLGKKGRPGGWWNGKHLKAVEYVAVRLSVVTESRREPEQRPATDGRQPVPDLPRRIWNASSPPLSPHLLWGLCCHVVWQRADMSPLQGKGCGWPVVERWRDNVFYPALLMLLLVTLVSYSVMYPVWIYGLIAIGSLLVKKKINEIK